MKKKAIFICCQHRPRIGNQRPGVPIANTGWVYPDGRVEEHSSRKIFTRTKTAGFTIFFFGHIPDANCVTSSVKMRKLERMMYVQRIDRILICPHHLDEDCECRNQDSFPFRTIKGFRDIDLNESYTISRDPLYLKSGRNIGTRTILVGRRPNNLGHMSEISIERAMDQAIRDSIERAEVARATMNELRSLCF